MKHKRSDRPVQKCIHIPRSIVEKIDEQLADVITGRPEFGAYSKLCTALLLKWLKGEVTVPTPLRIKPRPFCHKCLLDAELIPTCNDYQCPFKENMDEKDTPPTSTE